MTDDPSGLTPDEAFALVADETRLEILRTLAAADEPLSFSTLFERTGYDTRSNFSYHLDRLAGHFISRTDEGYALRQTGQRVVEAVVSGTMTEDPVVNRAPTDRHCPFCRAPIEVSYQQERVELFCTACPGLARREDAGPAFDTEFGSLGAITLPPAGVSDRDPTALLDAAGVWTHLDLLANSAGVCARCSGAVDHSVTVCADHDPDGGVCERCDRRYAVLFAVECRQCPYSEEGIALARLLAETELLAFVTEHGLNPLDPETRDRAETSPSNYEEEVVSIDPFEARFTFAAGDEALTLTVDDELAVVDATRRPRDGSGE